MATPKSFCLLAGSEEKFNMNRATGQMNCKTLVCQNIRLCTDFERVEKVSEAKTALDFWVNSHSGRYGCGLYSPHL